MNWILSFLWAKPLSGLPWSSVNSYRPIRPLRKASVALPSVRITSDAFFGFWVVVWSRSCLLFQPVRLWAGDTVLSKASLPLIDSSLAPPTHPHFVLSQVLPPAPTPALFHPRALHLFFPLPGIFFLPSSFTWLAATYPSGLSFILTFSRTLAPTLCSYPITLYYCSLWRIFCPHCMLHL